MTAGLLDQSVTILFSGSGLIQLQDSAIREKIEYLQEFLSLRLCADQESPYMAGDLEVIPQYALSSFMTDFDRILSF